MADFQYFNIMDVDPNFAELEEGMYTVRINKMVYQKYTPQSGKNAGNEVIRVNGDFAVVNHEKFSGRRIFNTFWLTNTFDTKALRKVADRTGIVQEPTETFEQWTEKLSTLQPMLKVKVNVVDDIDYRTKEVKVDEATGKPVKRAVINWREIFVAE